MNREQFDIAIQNNIPLILLDNLVLNVGGFIDQHPGGRFVIQHNLGHDISKYFYGGYCLEDNTGPIPAQGHSHSNIARIIVNSLTVAMYEDDIPTKILVCKQKKED